MQLTIEPAKDGFLAFGEGAAFFAPTRLEAAAGAIAEMEKNPKEPEVEYTELTDVVADMYGILNDPNIRVHVNLNLNIRPMAVMAPEQAAELQRALAEKMKGASMGLSAVSTAVSDLLMGKRRIIILEKI